MTDLLVDTSVLITWFHRDGESGVAEARTLRRAHVAGEISAHVLDLALYEVGNVLSRALRWAAHDVAGQLDDLVELCGPPLALTQDWLHDAAALAAEHRLSFYDASWAAAARGLRVPLVSSDRALVTAGLAEPAASVVARLRLRTACR